MFNYYIFENTYIILRLQVISKYFMLIFENLYKKQKYIKKTTNMIFFLMYQETLKLTSTDSFLILDHYFKLQNEFTEKYCKI